jgi:hypothetical protein
MLIWRGATNVNRNVKFVALYLPLDLRRYNCELHQVFVLNLHGMVIGSSLIKI